MTMIIACPACDTRYAVPENAIGNEGRTVRCAKCKHSWHQEPFARTRDAPEPIRPAEAQREPQRTEPSVSAAPPPAPPPASVREPGAKAPGGPSINHWKPSDYPSQSIGSRAMRRGLADQNAPTEEETPSFPDAVDEDPPEIEAYGDPLAQEGNEAFANEANELYGPEHEPDFDESYGSEYDEDDDASQFDYSPPFTARRNPMRMWTAAAAIFALLATGTVVAVNFYGLPDWLPIQRPTFGIGQPDLELDFPKAEQRTETLESGEEIFRVRGAITNTGRESVTVPSLLIVFRDERDKPVGNWVVVPSKSRLAPGESLNVTEAIADIPATADAAEIGWSPN